MRPSLLLSSLPIFLPLSTRAQSLKQIHVVTRHGARTRLEKSATTLDESDAVLLTALGQQQHYELGSWLRDRYSPSVVGETYDASLVRLESSKYDRTMVSAQSLALGLFPTTDSRDTESLIQDEGQLPANIPVYTNDRIHDIFLRAYDKCPTYTKKLQRLYQSTEWVLLGQNSASFLGQLEEIFPSYAPLHVEDLWNLYDAIHVAKTECKGGNSQQCMEADPDNIRDLLSGEQWNNLQSLTHTAELRKYGKETAGNLLGGNLLHLMWNRMLAEDGSGQFYLYSAHYPTILGLFAALDVEAPSSVVPDYAEALIIEYYEADGEGSEPYIVFKYKKGGDLFQTLTLSSVCGDRHKCPFHSFTERVQKLPSAEEWCLQCDNIEADVCLLQELEFSRSFGMGVDEAEEPCDAVPRQHDDNVWAVFGAFVGGVCVGVIFWIVVSTFLRRQHALCSKVGSSSGLEMVVDGSSISGDADDYLAANKTELI